MIGYDSNLGRDSPTQQLKKIGLQQITTDFETADDLAPSESKSDFARTTTSSPLKTNNKQKSSKIGKLFS